MKPGGQGTADLTGSLAGGARGRHSAAATWPRSRGRQKRRPGTWSQAAPAAAPSDRKLRSRRSSPQRVPGGSGVNRRLGIWVPAWRPQGLAVRPEMGPAGAGAVSAEDRAERVWRAWRGAAVRFAASRRLSPLLPPGTGGKSDGRMLAFTFPGRCTECASSWR